MLKVPNGLRWVGRIYILGVTVRFSFDCVNSRKIQGLSKIKQRERLMKVYIIYSPYWLHTIDWCGVMGATIYFTLAWGFRRCSFRQSGQFARSLHSEASNRTRLHVFFVYVSYIKGYYCHSWSLLGKGGKTKCDKTYDGINQRKCL